MKANYNLFEEKVSHPGLCHCEAMEKEAAVILDPIHAINCQHPILVSKVDKIKTFMFEQISKIRETAKQLHKQETEKLCAEYHCTPQTPFVGNSLYFDPYCVNEILDFLNSKLQGNYLKDSYTQDSIGIEQQLRLDRENDEDGVEQAYEDIDAYVDAIEIAEAHGRILVEEYEYNQVCGREVQSHAVPRFRPRTLKWLVNHIANRIALESTRIDEFPCTCNGECELALRQILNTGDNAKPVICYNSCLRTLFAAFKRQLRRVAHPDSTTLQEFGSFAKDMIDKYLSTPLAKFDYSYSQWYNKMPLAKQKKMDGAKQLYKDQGAPDTVEFGLFCKREKQEEGGKNRAIANIADICKYIMGPVTWRLENICDNYFPGYCGGKNWDSLEDYYSYADSMGYKYVLQGDGSGFDLSQHAEIKQFVDYYVYSLIKDKIHHVSEEDFCNTAIKSKFRKLKAVLMENKSMTNLATAIVYGTVFSGASDTTLMNTLRMALYNHFTLQKMGLKYGEDYLLLCKGDDFIVFVKNDQLKYSEAYYKYWVHKIKDPYDMTNYRRYGIGQCLKFLIKGDYQDIDFCSTCTIRTKTGFKIIRRPERVVMFNPFSRAALSMSPSILKQYLYDLALALEVSHGNIPLFNNYIRAYRTLADGIKAEVPSPITRPSKNTIPADGHEERPHYGAEDLFPYYGYEYHQKFFMNYSTHKITDDEVYNFLLDQYGITRSDIEYQYPLLIGHGSFDPVQQSISEHTD